MGTRRIFMKPFPIFICIGLFGFGDVFAVPNNWGVVKCVPLSTSTTCTTTMTGPTNALNWVATCNNATDGISGISVSGVAGCSNASGGTSDTLSTSSTVNDNRHCWCKMTSPAVSKWVYMSLMSGYSDCATNCSYMCANQLKSDSTFRAAMFGNMGA